MENNEKEIILLKDSEWVDIDSEACRVINFSPLATIENGKIKSPNLSQPYCALTLECDKLSSNATGYITHKIDFSNLWEVFKVRKLHEKEEVIIYWTQKNYKKGWMKHLGATLPKLIVWVCRKNTYDALINPDYFKLGGEAWFDFIRPMVELKPDVMK